MAKSDVFVRAAWPIRDEGPEQIAGRLLPTLRELGEVDPLLAGWCTAEQDEVFGSLEDLAGWVREQESTGAPGGTGFWPTVFSNGPREEGFSMGVTAGVRNQSPTFRNEVSIRSKPKQEPVAFLTRHAEAVLSVVVRQWEPDWAAVATLEMYDVQPWRNQRSPVVGGLTWLSDRRGVVPDLSGQALVTRVAGGSLIDVREDDGTLPTLHGIDRVARVAESLYEAGLLMDMPIRESETPVT